MEGEVWALAGIQNKYKHAGIELSGRDSYEMAIKRPLKVGILRKFNMKAHKLHISPFFTIIEGETLDKKEKAIELLTCEEKSKGFIELFELLIKPHYLRGAFDLVDFCADS